MEQAAPLLLGGKGIHPWPARPGSAEIPGATGTAAAATTRPRRTHAAAGTGHPAATADCSNCEYSRRWHGNVLLTGETQAECLRPTEASCVHVQSPVVLQAPRRYPRLPEAAVPEQDTERWECHWQAELPSDRLSPGLTAHPKRGQCLWNRLKSREQTASHDHLLQLFPTEARRSHAAVSEATWLQEGFWLRRALQVPGKGRAGRA